jgi:hypothetical protein
MSFVGVALAQESKIKPDRFGAVYLFYTLMKTNMQSKIKTLTKQSILAWVQMTQFSIPQILCYQHFQDVITQI